MNYLEHAGEIIGEINPINETPKKALDIVQLVGYITFWKVEEVAEGCLSD